MQSMGCLLPGAISHRPLEHFRNLGRTFAPELTFKNNPNFFVKMFNLFHMSQMLTYCIGGEDAKNASKTPLMDPKLR